MGASTPQWLFGLAGDLRPLPPPERDIGTTLSRYGGVHQGINGGRTVDRLGFKRTYTFNLRYLGTDDIRWLESLYTQADPGQLKLINPMKTNLFSLPAWQMKPDFSGAGGALVLNSSQQWVTDRTLPVPGLSKALYWVSTHSETPTSVIRIDRARTVPIADGEELCFSTYAYCDGDCYISLAFDQFRYGEQVSATTQVAFEVPAGQWTRGTTTVTGDGFFDSISPTVWCAQAPASTSPIVVGAPQVEYGGTPTDASPGGGCVDVAISAMDSTSPRYPYESINLTLLEV